MSSFTKKAIEAAFIELIESRPLSQITVKDVAEKCGITRNTFYYHFADMPTLIRKIVISELDTVIKSHPDIILIEERFDLLAKAMDKQKKAILHIYRSVDREVFETYLMHYCEYVVAAGFEQTFSNMQISRRDREIIIRLFKCSYFGGLIDWINNGMEYDIISDFHRISEIKRESINELIKNLK